MHCESLVREEDRDRYLATLFAPAQHRAALFALYAFDLETAQVAFRVREPLAGEIRLQWWHDVIEDGAEAHAAGHPVAVSLLATRDEYRLPNALLLGVIAARRSELETVPFETFADFSRYAHRADGAVLRLASQIMLEGKPPAFEILFQTAGEAAAIARLIAAFARYRLQGKVVVPVDILAAHGLRTTDLLTEEERPELAVALADWAARGLASLDRARALLPDIPQAIWPALLPVVPARAVLTAATQPGFRPAVPHETGQWRRQLHLWWVSRDLARRL